MKKACPCLTAIALALSVSAIPAPSPAAPTNPGLTFVPEVAPPPHDRVPPYAHTAIGAVIEANGWKVPATGTELTTALRKLGDFVQLPVTFSAVALNSGLSHPRVVIATRPSSHPGMVAQATGGFGGWGGSRGPTRLVAGTSAPLGSAAANSTYLEGRLFLAANTEASENGPVVKTVEFISWNSRKQKFDFGVIEGMSEKPELKILDGARCFSCHKNKGPILGVAPWSNTAFNELVRTTSTPLFKFTSRQNQEGKEDSALGLRDDIDGLKLLAPSGPEVDAAVRQGADVLRDRARYKLLAQTAEGRKALVLLLSAIAAQGPLEKFDKQLKLELNQLDLVPFLQQAHAANKALAPSALADFSPAGPANKIVATKGPTGTNPVTKYDALRATGAHGLPSLHQPSNPKAFVRPNTPAPQNPSQLVSAVALARAIGLSEGDRTFLATNLSLAVTRIGRTDVTPATLAKTVFTGPSFADVLKDGVLPERDDFKDRFVAGVVEVTARHQAGARFWAARTTYTSTPQRDPSATNEKEIEVLPSHACATCHDFRTGPKPAAFSPIPVLAFDPLDATTRDNWLKTASRKQRQDVLGRLLKRIDKDKDMPPEDSVEAELYRVKDPTAISALKEWLDAELKKAK
ncbi:hypothetical protein J8F10_03970 [Gemmata sp. G18]|uniref:Cytochrome c domain-containing protein n=1 Tax=Gemmata palustris TaxID=2822762 RepID=A0ABS5BL55_9BACT|nr:hypothetical protein [Gemmata palustris]MBP3954445.1 hypothetical protein [Gemmata palustris]